MERVMRMVYTQKEVDTYVGALARSGSQSGFACVRVTVAASMTKRRNASSCTEAPASQPYHLFLEHLDPRRNADGRIVEAACWAHARRKYYDVYVMDRSPTAHEALTRGSVSSMQSSGRSAVRHRRIAWRLAVPVRHRS